MRIRKYLTAVPVITALLLTYPPVAVGQSLGDAATAEAQRRAKPAAAATPAKPAAPPSGSPDSSSSAGAQNAGGALGGATAPRKFNNETLLELRDQNLSQGTYSAGAEAGPDTTVPAPTPTVAPAPALPAPAPPVPPAPAAAQTATGGQSGAASPTAPNQPSPSKPTDSPIPELDLARWEADMLSYGQRHCARYDDPTLTADQRLGGTYYDAIRVFYQIADYTGDPAWNRCAAKARAAYRDAYVIPNKAGVPGYWNFTTGLRMDWERTGDPRSKTAAIDLSRKAAYTSDQTPLQWTAGTDLSREVAYSILSYLNAEALGEPRRARLAAHAEQAFGHINQWFVTRTSRAPVPFAAVPSAAGQYYIQPFMVGLTTQALIRYWEVTDDPRILPAIAASLDSLWERAWVPRDESFWYQNWVGDPKQPFPAQPGAPDLNLLIAPAFAWMYAQTGDPKYRDRGDQVFAGGVRRAYLAGPKQFNQNYMWSFDYVRWRSGQRSAPASR